MVKNLPAILEMRVQSLGRGDPLEKRMATHFSILAKGVPWTEEPGGLQSMGLQRVGHNIATKQQQHTKEHCFNVEQPSIGRTCHQGLS